MLHTEHQMKWAECMYATYHSYLIVLAFIGIKLTATRDPKGIEALLVLVKNMMGRCSLFKNNVYSINKFRKILQFFPLSTSSFLRQWTFIWFWSEGVIYILQTNMPF